MRIWHDYSYHTDSNRLWIVRGYAQTDFHSLRFQYLFTESEIEQNSKFYETHSAAEQEKRRIQLALTKSEVMAPIMGAIAEQFVCYQYQHGDHPPFVSTLWDLFFWCNCFYNTMPGVVMPDRDYSYFTLSFNTKQTVEKRSEVCQRVLAFLQDRFACEPHLDVAVQHSLLWDEAKINADIEKVKSTLVGQPYALGQKSGTLVLHEEHLCFRAKHARKKFYRLSPRQCLELAIQLGLLSDRGLRDIQIPEDTLIMKGGL